jgi:dihydroorotate dehydrogenase
MIYKNIIRPILFKVDPEKIHHFTLSIVRTVHHLPFIPSLIKDFFSPEESSFHKLGLTFKNRIGLSAGFDKEASAFNALADFGFGLIEVGTLTPHAFSGNPKKRIFRIPEALSLISRTGFNNPGVEVAAVRLSNRRKDVVLGANINHDTASQGLQVISDFVLMYKTLCSYVDYFVINWGSFDFSLADDLFIALNKAREDRLLRKPVLLKLSADLSTADLLMVVKLFRNYHFDGFIASGPSQNRNLLISKVGKKRLDSIGAGGVSGWGVGSVSCLMVRELRNLCGKEPLIIGSGGVMTPADAKAMIDAGADLVQIYSAFIYYGPSIVKYMSNFIS